MREHHSPSQARKGGRPRVVVVGAGFGGLAAVGALKKAPADITLVHQRSFHLFQPLLYQVATAALSPDDIAWPVRSIFEKQRNVTVLMMKVTAIDAAAQTITDGDNTIDDDYLVLATGATHAIPATTTGHNSRLASRRSVFGRLPQPHDGGVRLVLELRHISARRAPDLPRHGWPQQLASAPNVTHN